MNDFSNVVLWQMRHICNNMAFGHPPVDNSETTLYLWPQEGPIELETVRSFVEMVVLFNTELLVHIFSRATL